MLHIFMTITACVRFYQQKYCCYHGHHWPKGLMFSTGSCWYILNTSSWTQIEHAGAAGKPPALKRPSPADDLPWTKAETDTSPCKQPSWPQGQRPLPREVMGRGTRAITSRSWNKHQRNRDCEWRWIGQGDGDHFLPPSHWRDVHNS